MRKFSYCIVAILTVLMPLTSLAANAPKVVWTVKHLV